MKSFNKTVRLISIISVLFFAGIALFFLIKLEVFKLGTALFCLGGSSILYWHITKILKIQNSQ